VLVDKCRGKRWFRIEFRRLILGIGYWCLEYGVGSFFYRYILFVSLFLFSPIRNVHDISDNVLKERGGGLGNAALG